MITPSIVTFLITALNIAILFFVLRRLLFKPVTKFMAERTRRIEESINQAEKDKTQAKALLAQYEDQLKSAETEVEAILRSARETAEQDAKEIIQAGKQQAQQYLEGARKQFEGEQHAALAQFRAQAAGLVILAATQVLKRELNAEDLNRFAQMTLAELGSD
ncbi:F0F1 ATP synthase subunit B [Breznakiellaceae bacterium SP9]